MEITGLNKYCQIDVSSKEACAKYNSGKEINIADVFNNNVINWIEKNKEKISENLENDREKNIKMSDKQWHDLLNKVDSIINTQKQAVADSSILNNENEQPYNFNKKKI